MADPIRQRGSSPYLRLIRIIGVIVPRRLRAEWKQEWEAELLHREALLEDWGAARLEDKISSEYNL
jgi:hypothetical protein